jgi:prolipoprotein diacylglyceryltransferase
MITISIDPIIFQIGHFALRRYGLIVLAAIQVGIWLTAREVDAKNSERNFYGAVFWIIIAGSLGAVPSMFLITGMNIHKPDPRAMVGRWALRFARAQRQ